MTPFISHRGKVVPLPRRDIDTDQIIPKQFLTAITRTGFGRGLFHEWRQSADAGGDPFVLDQPRYAGASILATGENFGCGSSREHAVWAILQAGFRVILAPSFADIFAANAVTNGLLALPCPVPLVDEVMRRAEAGGYELDVDLETCEVRDNDGLRESFSIAASARSRLMRGLDAIDLVLEHEAAITRYEISTGR